MSEKLFVADSFSNGSVAQLVEHCSETAGVVSANLTGTTIYISHIYQYSTYFWLPQDKSKYSVNSMVEYCSYKAGVIGSSPIQSTTPFYWVLTKEIWVLLGARQ